MQFTIIEGRAKLGEDFITGGGTLTGTLIFQEGSAVSYIQLQIIDDTTPEDTENLAVFLDSITGSAVFGTATSAEVDIEISDDPFGVIGFSDSSMLLEIRNPTVSEGDLSVSLTVDRVRGTMGSVEVQYQVIPTHPLQQVCVVIFSVYLFINTVHTEKTCLAQIKSVPISEVRTSII